MSSINRKDDDDEYLKLVDETVDFAAAIDKL